MHVILTLEWQAERILQVGFDGVPLVIAEGIV